MKNNSIRFILERAQEFNLQLNINNALNVICNNIPNHIVYPKEHMKSIACFEVIFNVYPPETATLNQLVNSTYNANVIIYLVSKGADNIASIYLSGFMTGKTEIDILKTIMNRSQDKALHLETLQELKIDSYINTYEKLKYLMSNGILFHQENMPLVQQILAENNHIVYTSKLALNRTTDLPSELQQYITDFVKLRGI
jgi:hypothetical protein